jgi:exonuclease SbcC
MRLLKITVENLNSLYGKHVVDLEGELGGAAIFLVVGETGAGKTTLTDAVSLALFGQTPRLVKGKSDSDPELDARNVISRGAGFGMAQVELMKSVGGQSLRFRATWYCRRAREKADGALQLPKRTLERWVDGAWETEASDTREKFYAEAFESVLEGMTVQDFQRCVLLAQGEFAAFLEATDDERAAILERLTDTAVYQQIGARANRRRQQAEHEYDQALAKTEGVAVLPDDERVRLADEVLQIGKAFDALSKAWASKRNELEWLRTNLGLDAAARTAARAVETACRDRQQSATQLGQLAEHERCEKAGESLKIWEHRAEHAGSLVRELAHHTAIATETCTQVAALREAEQQATANLEQTKSNAKAKAPAIVHARELHRQWASDREELAAATTQARDALERHLAKKSEFDVAAVALNNAIGSWDEANEAHRGLESVDGLRVSLVAFRHRVASLGELTAAFRADETTLSSLRGRLQTHQAALKGHLEEGNRLGAAFTLDEKGTTEARARLTDVLAGADSPQACRDLLDVRLEKTAEGKERATLARQLKDGVAEGLRNLAGLEVTCGTAGEKLKVAEAHAVELRSSLSRIADEQTMRTDEREQLRWAQSVAQQRDRLQRGESCPLCGSEDHPWLVDRRHEEMDAKIAATCGKLDRELSELRLQAEAEGKLLKVRELECATTRVELDVASKRLHELSSVLDEKRIALSKTLELISLPADATTNELDEALRALAQERDAIATQKKRVADAEKALVDAERAFAETSKKLEACRQQIDRESTEAWSMEETIRERAERLESASATLHEKQASLLVDLESHKVMVEEVAGELDFARALIAAETRVAALTAAEANLKRAEEARGKREVAVESRRAALQEALVAEEQARMAMEARALRVADSERMARAALDGRAPDDVQRELEHAEELAQRELAERASTARAKESELAVVATRVGQLEADSREARAKRDEARAELDRHLRALELENEDALRGCLLDEQARASMTALRERLIRRCEEAHTVALERQKVLDEHIAKRPESLQELSPTVETLAVEVDQLETQRLEEQKALGARQNQLSEDDRNRQRLAVLGAELDKARANAALWGRLHGLIGVSDGAEFKRFAQSLNLAELIGKANDHLARLAPRYSLVQAVDGKGGLRIAFSIRDEWQAGEKRPLTTLSGGETFLVSLALALSLADYRTTKTPIETLLLDEGFGTLDQETLSVVMRTLEALHATGMQIGIITHVEAMREHIDARVVVKKLGGGRSVVHTEIGGTGDY